MSPTLEDILIRELGRDSVLARGAADWDDYRRDESKIIVGEPDMIVVCHDRRQVPTVLRLAAEHKVPITPRGAGSGKAGGCVATSGGIVLSLAAVDRIVTVDPDDLVVVAEAGAITGHVMARAAECGLFYPPDPASLDCCTIGGNVATNAGGARAFKYGVTRDYVLGVEVVLMGGETVRFGGRTAKRVSGADLVGPFVGSEGTLGIVTEVTLKLIPSTEDTCALLATFGDRRPAVAAVSALLQSGFYPSALELIDGAALAAMFENLGHPNSGSTALLIEVDGTADSVESAAEAVGTMCERHGARDVRVAHRGDKRRALWAARRGVSRALRRDYPHKVSEDICVPRGAMAAALDAIDSIAARHDLAMCAYGHAGDGNLHVNFLLREETPSTAIEPAIRALFEATIQLGGTLSGEHGIGAAKRDYMSIEHSAAALTWQRKLKTLFDPDGLLNPGKVLPRSSSWPEASS